MPRITEEASRARCAEIVNAAETLYQTQNYRDITMAQIAGKLTFGRANIYNYFQCKDEIFLALLQREYTLWEQDLAALRDSIGALDGEALAAGLAASLQKREQMLRLLVMDLYEIEEGCRPDNLTALKRVYLHAVDTLESLLRACKPQWDETQVDRFIYAFLPFVYGVYPYVHATDKQRAAIEAAGGTFPDKSIYELVEQFVRKMTADT